MESEWTSILDVAAKSCDRKVIGSGVSCHRDPTPEKRLKIDGCFIFYLLEIKSKTQFVIQNIEQHLQDTLVSV